jgi:hypothetical protein
MPDNETLRLLSGLPFYLLFYLTAGYALWKGVPSALRTWLEERERDRADRREERKAFRNEIKELALSIARHDEAAAERADEIIAEIRQSRATPTPPVGRA